MNQLKPGYEKIKKQIEYLIEQPWLADSQKHWPPHLFHFTNIDNAVSILSDGFLLPRSELEKKGKLKTDIASPGIISETLSEWKNFVRLYFRPRTPMQYRNVVIFFSLCYIMPFCFGYFNIAGLPALEFRYD